MPLLAVCEGSDPNPGGAAALALVALALYFGPLTVAFVTAPDGARAQLFAVYGCGVGLSVLFGYVIPGGLTNTGADFKSLFLAGLLAGAMFGAVVAVCRPIGDVWRHVVLGTFGAGTFLAWAVGLLLLGFEATGACWG